MLRDQTALVSVMTANNEVGTVRPIAEIGALCRERGIVFHTDAAQAIGKLPIEVAELKVDLLSLSGHKLYGPKGIGALYVSRHCPAPLEPLIVGGAQQQGLRAGTVPPFLCAGLGEACRIAGEELERDGVHCEALRDAFWSILSSRLPDAVINGDLDHRLPGNLNVLFPGSDANSLLASLGGQVAASTGSACNAGLIGPSYVLLALGLTLEEANSSIRFGFGRFTSMDDVERAATLLADKAEHFHRTLAVS
jgi:cysteine desulfurase